MISYTRQEKVVVMVKTPRWSNILPFEKKPSKWMSNQGPFQTMQGVALRLRFESNSPPCEREEKETMLQRRAAG